MTDQSAGVTLFHVEPASVDFQRPSVVAAYTIPGCCASCKICKVLRDS